MQRTLQSTKEGKPFIPALGGDRVFEGDVKHCLCLQNASSLALWARKERWEQAWHSPGRWAGLLPDEKTKATGHEDVGGWPRWRGKSK